MKIISVEEMISKGIKKSKTLREALIKAYWKDIVDKMEVKSEVIKIKDEILIVKVEGSANLHFMTMKKNIYLENIEKLLKGKYIKKINYKLGKVNLQNKLQNKLEEIKEAERIKDVDYSIYSLEERIELLAQASKKREKYLLQNGYSKCIQCDNLFLGNNLKCPKCRGIEDKTVVNKY
ncbi:MAG: DciA family protein [Fusobacterium sp. JB021]|nr:DciA family protein [Fusobacterium sp. JB020]MDP0494550.1 DciA family protein [Fusobacterium sp. JB021]MDP0507579.1 DciA family protein [Fusobacterium sp. JB019]